MGTGDQFGLIHCTLETFQCLLPTVSQAQDATDHLLLPKADNEPVLGGMISCPLPVFQPGSVTGVSNHQLRCMRKFLPAPAQYEHSRLSGIKHPLPVISMPTQTG